MGQSIQVVTKMQCTEKGARSLENHNGRSHQCHPMNISVSHLAGQDEQPGRQEGDLGSVPGQREPPHLVSLLQHDSTNRHAGS